MFRRYNSDCIFALAYIMLEKITERCHACTNSETYAQVHF